MAAKHLARKDWASLGICGCGGQAEAHLMAMLAVGRPERIVVYDLDGDKASAFAREMQEKIGTTVRAVTDLRRCVSQSDVLVTCTTSREYFVTRDLVRAGSFIAAVGADHEDKQELEPALLAASKLVTDVTAQAEMIGDLHHAIASGAMSRAQVHAELGEVVCGRREGRVSDDEVIVFDSTGTGVQDVAAAIAVYLKARDQKAGAQFSFSERGAA